MSRLVSQRPGNTRPRRGLAAPGAVIAAVIGAALAFLSACTTTPVPRPDRSFTPGPYSSKPNIVFVLTDDLSTNLIKFMPHVVGLMATGMSFTNYSVTDSLCCPSRSSIFTGEFPHNTHVFTNSRPLGGMYIFKKDGNERRTFAVALKRAGYRTALMGKYLNGYRVGLNDMYPSDYIPPGWSSWAVADDGYPEYNYDLNQNRKIVSYGGESKDYLTDVINGLGQDYVTSSVAARKPFMLELASFAPHNPYTPAERDRFSFLDLKAPRSLAFGHVPSDPPPWLRGRPGFTADEVHRMNRAYVKRVEAVQAVDRMIGNLETTLRRTGQLKNTVFVFSSDNGYHIGEHGLTVGKNTAFDTDVHVPLVISGPGIPAGTTNANVVENIDLAPTFEELAGVPVPPTVDGRSLVPLLHGANPPWRDLAAVEHRHPRYTPADPDAQTALQGNPPTYDALRTADWTYVRYVDGSREFYDRTNDPYELHNVAAKLSPHRISQLDRMLDRLTTCVGAEQCWSAAHLDDS